MILNLSSFIYSLLLENDTVIIPGFGAFISTYKPAEIGENEIKPPSKVISFTQQIKNNDGLLVEIIARKAKISQTNALKRVEKARENMLYELDKGNTVILENIGSISYNENNQIEFVPIEEDNLLLDSFGLDTISTEDAVKKKFIVEPDEDKENEKTQLLAGAAILNKTEGTEETIPEPDSSEKVTESDTDVKNENETVDEKGSEEFKFPEFKPATTIDNEEEEDERWKIAWYWYILILLPIFVGVYFVIMNNSKSTNSEIQGKKNTNIEQKDIQAKTTTPTDTVQNDSIFIEDTKESTVAIIEPTDQNQGPKYYLIAGGFEEQENVEEYILQLKEKGIESFVAGKTGRLILVGIEKFDSEEDANRSLNAHFKTNPERKLWIYKK